MISKHDFLVAQNAPKMIHLGQLFSIFCQNLDPESTDSKCKSQVFNDRQNSAQTPFFVTHFPNFQWFNLLQKKQFFLSLFVFCLMNFIRFRFVEDCQAIHLQSDIKKFTCFAGSSVR